MELIPPVAYLDILACPTCEGALRAGAGGQAVICEGCGRSFPINAQGVLELVDPETLDAETRRELEGNTYRSTKAKRWAAVLAENEIIWQSYYWAQRRLSIEHLVRDLAEVDVSRLMLLGSGTGRDVLFLQRYLALGTVYCSDLSVSALALLRERLEDSNLKIGLFTSNLDRCPVASRDIPIVIVAALHHTQDMHAALERLLAKGYAHLFLVEPLTNALMRGLARRGWARRVEYSGVTPGRLALTQVRDLVRRYGYRLRVTTSWTFPEDYYRRVFPDWAWFRSGFFALLRALSTASNTVGFGNRAVISLQKMGA